MPTNNNQNTMKICPQCGLVEPYGMAKTCIYCGFSLVDTGFSFSEIMGGKAKSKSTPSISQIEDELVKKSPHFRQDLWEQRKGNTKTVKNRLLQLPYYICRICGKISNTDIHQCGFCHSSDLVQLDITGEVLQKLPLQKQDDKFRGFLVRYCYTYSGFDRDKWIKRITTTVQSASQQLINFVSQSHYFEYEDYMLSKGITCPQCGSDSIQVSEIKKSIFSTKKSLICLNCKTVFNYSTKQKKGTSNEPVNRDGSD